MAPAPGGGGGGGRELCAAISCSSIASMGRRLCTMLALAACCSLSNDFGGRLMDFKAPSTRRRMMSLKLNIESPVSALAIAEAAGGGPGGGGPDDDDDDELGAWRRSTSMRIAPAPGGGGGGPPSLIIITGSSSRFGRLMASRMALMCTRISSLCPVTPLANSAVSWCALPVNAFI